MRFSGCFFAITLGLVCLHASVDSQQPTQAPGTNSNEPNWANEYLAEDPLVAKDAVTLDDIRQGLESPRRRGTVIDRHFKRTNEATLAEKRQFLVLALKSEFSEVQRQAARELATLRLLEGVVRDLLIELVQSEDPQLRQVAVIALEHVDYKTEGWPDAYWDALVEGLASDDPVIVKGIAERLEGQGASAVPSLIKALHGPIPRVQREAAKIISQIVGSPLAKRPTTDGTSGIKRSESRLQPTPSPGVETVAKAPRNAESATAVRAVDVNKSKSVKVYFGTNRELFEAEHPLWSKILLYPVLSLFLLLGIGIIWWHPREDNSRGCTSIFMTFLFLVGILWTLSVFRVELLDRWRIGTGPRFGLRRDSMGLVHYGTCTISIPPKHERGVIESPIFGPEDESLHVVRKKTEEMEEKAFFDGLRDRIAKLPMDQRSCFVFIHGFNVTFENAAKRTAQIHYDLEFSGIPIFFSWPSRASWHHYFSDRNEIDVSRFVIKQFLLDVSQRVSADRIHVIAHSMGADATCRAIAELGDRGKIFDQIILAAPDIDRDVFRLQVVPRMTAAANRTTLYCSKNDMALLASNTFNDGPRAGDSRLGAFVTKEIDTVDASGIDTALLGHSYYGDCLPILDDVKKLFALNLSPKERNLLAWPVENELNYWTMAEQQLKSDGNAESDKTKESMRPPPPSR